MERCNGYGPGVGNPKPVEIEMVHVEGTHDWSEQADKRRGLSAHGRLRPVEVLVESAQRV